MRVLDLRGSIIMIPSRSLEAQLYRQARDHPSLPVSLGQIQTDLNERAGVSVTIDEPRDPGGDRSLLVHGSTYVMRLFLRKPFADSYTIAAVLPLRLRDHHRLAKGCLVLCRVRWHVVPGPMSIPSGSNGHWPRLTAEWSHVREGGQERAGSPVTPAQRSFLDTVSRIIDATERISTTTERPENSYAYRKVAPTGELRYGTQSSYEFHLEAPPPPDKKAFVQVRGEPEQRGQVTRTGEWVTVHFDQPIDFLRIPQQGYLEETPSTVVYRKQREAVNALRAGQASNAGLLAALVDNSIRRLRPADAQPTTPLDDDQLAAFRKALAVEDLLLVLGPPGTGKTRTIGQIVNTCASAAAPSRDSRRVLVTSHTNRAVDNVLPRLPRELLTIRVGNESGVTEEGKPYLLERLAADLREEIMRGVRIGLDAYGQIEHAASWAVELDRRIEALAVAIGRELEALGGLAAIRRQTGGPAQARVDQLTSKYQAASARLRRSTTVIARMTERRQRALERSGLPVLGGLYRFLARRADRRLALKTAEHARVSELSDQALRQLDAANRELDAVTRDIPAVRTALSTVDTTVRERADAVAGAVAAANVCRAGLAAISVPPAIRTGADSGAEPEDLVRLSSWLREALPVLRARARLLAAWHGETSGETSQLYPELIRYADVVAATCVGTASRPELSDVDFDLVIVDEAGQIGIPDVLIPLVRASRAVLVGDHRQLPPFLDTEVDEWGVADGDPAVRALLTKSVLELLVANYPPDNVVSLRWQRRMPAVIADFISTAFYAGELYTDVRRAHQDAVFERAFAFVDTSKLPPRTRAETRSGKRQEQWGRPGYVNKAEADLLVELATHYHRQGAEWAVIVPYRAQVDLISRRLERVVGSSRMVELNVGTVDSFQGGERDVLLYGFTRSNPDGRIGFLDELRRANVAFTRAKRQLVLVGDLVTLTNATDSRFRDLARLLRDYVAAHGDLRSYAQVRNRLGELRGEVAR